MGVQITFVEFLGPKDLMEATEGMQENQVMSCYVPERESADSQKNWVEGLPYTLTLFNTKICDFPYLIYDPKLVP